MALEIFIKKNGDIGKKIKLNISNDTDLKIRAYNRIIEKYSAKGTSYGSNEEIYIDIINELNINSDKIKEIYLALYLFNNKSLYSELVKLAKEGIRIIIFTIPLNGYGSRKIEFAKEVFTSVLRDNIIDLRVYPHMYIWYGARYAGGGAGYSFHIKAGLINYNNSLKKMFLTSGNLAPGDPTHTESALFIEGPANFPYFNTFQNFFSELENRSPTLKEYNQIKEKNLEGKSKIVQKAFDFSFIGKKNNINLDKDNATLAFFTAPFYLINKIGSNHYARERIIEIIMKAKEKILVCAQHIHDISPFDGYKGNTIIGAIRDKKKQDVSLNLKVLKQVASAGLADPRRAAFVEAHLYYSGVSQKINKLIHDKFIVVDNNVIITTSNLTSTQFGFGEKKMEYLTDSNNSDDVDQIINLASVFYSLNGEYSNLLEKYITRPRKATIKPQIKLFKNDIFSEINCFIIIENKELADHFTNYFNQLWEHKLSNDIEIPI